MRNSLFITMAVMAATMSAGVSAPVIYERPHSGGGSGKSRGYTNNKPKYAGSSRKFKRALERQEAEKKRAAKREAARQERLLKVARGHAK